VPDCNIEMILLIVPLLPILLVVAAVKAKRAGLSGFEVAMIVVVGASDIRAWLKV